MYHRKHQMLRQEACEVCGFEKHDFGNIIQDIADHQDFLVLGGIHKTEVKSCYLSQQDLRFFLRGKAPEPVKTDPLQKARDVVRGFLHASFDPILYDGDAAVDVE